MFPSSPAVWLVSLSTLVAFTASAQTAPIVSAPPATPASLSYRSALDGYQAFADEKPTPWRAANDIVNSRGGWRAYAREANGEPTDARTPAAADPHAGHAMPAPREKP